MFTLDPFLVRAYSEACIVACIEGINGTVQFLIFSSVKVSEPWLFGKQYVSR